MTKLLPPNQRRYDERGRLLYTPPTRHAYSRNCGCERCNKEWERRSVPVKK